MKSNKKKEEREREREYYIEQKIKIQNQSKPFCRVLEQAHLSKEKLQQGKQHQIKKHTHK